MRHVTVIGVDLSLVAPSFVMAEEGKMLDFDKMRTWTTSQPKSPSGPMTNDKAHRLARVARDGLKKFVLDAPNPPIVIIEAPVYSKSAYAHANAAPYWLCREFLLEAGVPFKEYSPSQIRRTVFGYNPSSKPKVFVLEAMKNIGFPWLGPKEEGVRDAWAAACMGAPVTVMNVASDALIRAAKKESKRK